MPNPTQIQITRNWGTSTRDPEKAVVQALNAHIQFQVAVDPANLAAGAVAETLVNIPAGTQAPPQDGMDAPVVPAAGDFATAMPPAALEAGLVFKSARVVSATQIGITLYNPTAGAIDGASRTWDILIIKALRLTV